MSCLTCGNRETAYTINGYGICGHCVGNMESISKPQSQDETDKQNPRMRHILAFLCLFWGIAAATCIAWMGRIQ